MPAPKKPKTTPEKQTGAPANARLLEDHAADAEREVAAIKEARLKLQERIARLDGNELAQKPLQASLSELGVQLEKAYDLWFKLSKQVREYDKAVAQDRREGETIPRIDAEEFFKQFRLSIKLAIEKYIISLSQDATRAESPEQFYQAHSDNIRTAFQSELESAQKDGKLPKWATVE